MQSPQLFAKCIEAWLANLKTLIEPDLSLVPREQWQIVEQALEEQQQIGWDLCMRDCLSRHWSIVVAHNLHLDHETESNWKEIGNTWAQKISFSSGILDARCVSTATYGYMTLRMLSVKKWRGQMWMLRSCFCMRGLNCMQWRTDGGFKYHLLFACRSHWDHDIDGWHWSSFWWRSQQILIWTVNRKSPFILKCWRQQIPIWKGQEWGLYSLLICPSYTKTLYSRRPMDPERSSKRLSMWYPFLPLEEAKSASSSWSATCCTHPLLFK